MTTTPRKILRTLSFIHLGILLGPLAAGIIFYFTTNLVDYNTINQEGLFIYIFPLIALSGIFIGKVLYSKFLIPLKDKETLQEKLTGFQTASLIQYALIEGPALLTMVWFNKTGNLFYLTIGGVLVIYLFILRPTKNKIEKDLELKGEHKRQFVKLDDVI